MSQLILDISTSLDGYVGGPTPTMDDPLGTGEVSLHEWAFALKAFRETHGMEGGEVTDETPMVQEYLARQGATIMGRKMYSGGSGPWEDDPNASGWWGEDPPFHHPVFVLTHHEREPLPRNGGTTFHFVTDGIESALERAREAAGDKDVAIGGGAKVAPQYLRAGLVDEVNLHITPVLLGAGERLFDDHLAEPPATWERVGLVDGPNGTIHARYRVG